MKTNKELFQERLKRYLTACYNEMPDRIPIRIFSEELSSKHSGYSNFEAAINYELQFEVNRGVKSEMISVNLSVMRIL